MYVLHHVHAWRSEEGNKYLELELETVVSHGTGAGSGNPTQSSARATRAVNQRAISPGPLMF